ncbi:conserved hypothetical protein [Trichormus variabilis ATCC 29413]|uniref:DUF2288 domain-containing protein n=2 Tax=Anabaena variabilis TaxID=264691 RepID=Q3M9J0_TRIV2|nr:MULTISPECIES: DUF2288 domain-containing protein [Nostocaceae]ABA22346.1 conserved hypothetical protein [Trichormus variabilis ATCC 29413]MBC1213235.1 DUF2288 domain-containing protein [Trichormus variabilis ARAD]MBC1256049.1 DUF2288 domain-containing protein [Trichormus variabilis V5]MBC1268085.1 DUF2288 domain-containing protein [Trichormus variabilis FSR]MBC1301778.1 DUF2288 domain-containing protein [Trichormus variabilis N2B]
MSDLRTELSETIDESEWEWLIPHAQRDAVILVSLDLNLLDVGEAIASDNIPSVQRWIDEQLISKPSPEQLGEWNINQQKRFNTLIIQPYVLIQEIAV